MMISDDIYFDMVDTSKVSSVQGALQEAEKLKRIDEFRLQQQINSPLYKKLSEQNALLVQQSNELIKQNDLIKQQLDLTIHEKERAEADSIKAKKLNIFMAIIASLSLIAAIVSIFVSIFA